MSRVFAAILLFATGLAVGLWLALDTERRAAVEGSWERARTSITQVQIDAGLDENSPQPASESSSSDQNQQSPEIPALAPLSRLVADLWNATQKWWFGLLARLELAP